MTTFTIYNRTKTDEKIKHEKELTKAEVLSRVSKLLDSNSLIKLKIKKD